MPQKDTMEFWPRTFIRGQMFAWLITNYIPFLLWLCQPRLYPYSTLLLPIDTDKEERKNCYFLWAPALWGKISVTWRVLSPYFQIIKQTHFNNQKDQRALTGSEPVSRDRNLAQPCPEGTVGEAGRSLVGQASSLMMMRDTYCLSCEIGY